KFDQTVLCLNYGLPGGPLSKGSWKPVFFIAPLLIPRKYRFNVPPTALSRTSQEIGYPFDAPPELVFKTTSQARSGTYNPVQGSFPFKALQWNHPNGLGFVRQAIISIEGIFQIVGIGGRLHIVDGLKV